MWTPVELQGYEIRFTNGGKLVGCGSTGFFLKSGVSKVIFDIKPGNEMMHGIVQSVVPQKKITYWLDGDELIIARQAVDESRAATFLAESAADSLSRLTSD